MDFGEGRATYVRLKRQFDQNQLSAQDFESQVYGIRVLDSAGALWSINARSGKWVRREGDQWVEVAPPLEAKQADASSALSSSPSGERTSASRKKPFPWVWVFGGLGALALLACIAVVVVAIVLGRGELGSLISGIPGMGGTTVPGFDSSDAFVDDFSDPESGWDRTGDNDGLSDYADGQYNIRVDTTSLLIWANPNQPAVADVDIEVDATKAGGPDDNLLGVLCRYESQDNFYAGLISSDGYFVIAKQQDGESSFVSGEEWQTSDAIRQGASTNHLRFTCIGEALELYVNGQQIASATDGSFESGDVGLIVGTYDVPGVDILFDDFSATTR